MMWRRGYLQTADLRGRGAIKAGRVRVFRAVPRMLWCTRRSACICSDRGRAGSALIKPLFDELMLQWSFIVHLSIFLKPSVRDFNNVAAEVREILNELEKVLPVDAPHFHVVEGSTKSR